MEIELLKDELNKLWAGEIKQICFDILRHTINLEIETIDNKIKNTYQVVFIEVSSYYFINNRGEERYNLLIPEKDDFLELSSIDYYENGIGEIKIDSLKENWVREWKSSSNFALEIWNSLLLIESKKISINSKLFDTP